MDCERVTRVGEVDARESSPSSAPLEGGGSDVCFVLLAAERLARRVRIRVAGGSSAGSSLASFESRKSGEIAFCCDMGRVDRMGRLLTIKMSKNKRSGKERKERHTTHTTHIPHNVPGRLAN